MNTYRFHLEKYKNPGSRYTKQIEEGYDIADFLINSSPPQNILQAFLEKNPLLERLIETFNLRLNDVSTCPSISSSCGKMLKGQVYAKDIFCG